MAGRMTQDDEHLRGHIRRRFYHRVNRPGYKDVDQVARVRMLRIVQWSVPFGGAIGVLLGGQLGHPWLGGLLGALLATGFALFMVEAGGRLGRTLYNPTGSSTPHKRDYSLAASLAIRGQHAEAAEAYEMAVSEYPEDPEPYLCLARMLRDEMGRPEDAIRWFKRARAEATVSDAQGLLISRELVEIYMVNLGEPARAAPELSRLAERYAGTPEGDWARDELADVKRRMLDAEEA